MIGSRLVVLTDRHQLPSGCELVSAVAQCAGAGLTTVVLRELDLPQPDRAGLAEDLARHVRVIAARTHLPGTLGVHLAAHQPAPATPGARRCHGRSCHDEQEVRAAVTDGAGYVTLSPVAASASKPGYGPPLGVGGVRRAVAAAGSVPVYALGGVGADNAAGLREAGAYGVAVMGAVMRSDRPADLVAQLLEAVS